MKIAIPVKEMKEQQSIIYGHFGSAPYYAIYDDSSKELFFIENDEQHHLHGQCQPTAELVKKGVEAVICNALGARAVFNLNQLGIKVYYGENADTVGDLLGKMQNKALAEFSQENICHQHECH